MLFELAYSGSSLLDFLKSSNCLVKKGISIPMMNCQREDFNVASSSGSELLMGSGKICGCLKLEELPV